MDLMLKIMCCSSHMVVFFFLHSFLGFFFTLNFRSGTSGSSCCPFLLVYAVARLAFSISSPAFTSSSLFFPSLLRFLKLLFCLSPPDLAKYFSLPSSYCFHLLFALNFFVRSLQFFHSLSFPFLVLQRTPFKTALHFRGQCLLCLLPSLYYSPPHCSLSPVVVLHDFPCISRAGCLSWVAALAA